MSLRVREILDGLKGTGRKPLLKLIPKPTLPADTKGLFPNAIMSTLPHDQKYSIVGLITESLVLSNEPITATEVILELIKLGINPNSVQEAKIKKSKTTQDYINKILKTREELQRSLREFNGLPDGTPHTIIQGEELTHECVQGHPDGICAKSVIEVKTTSKLDDDINYYMLQVCSYVALSKGRFTQAILVLPLQQSVIALDMRLWTKRKQFRDLLVEKAQKLIETRPKLDPQTLIASQMLLSEYAIGTHTRRAPTLLETVQALATNIPYQIFLGGNQNSRLNIKDADLVAAAEYILDNNISLYIHSPYLINLSSTTEDNWQIDYMRRLLTYGATLGTRGVVVHTGKHTKATYEDGVETMRQSIIAILDSATPNTPLLLETPAGQGTETLQGQDEFLDFVASFESPNIAVCVDTCHVFANGHDPLTYIQAAHGRGLLRLVHFNDSEECCGSCKDRHALAGTGHIGLEKMTAIAEFCKANGTEMVVE